MVVMILANLTCELAYSCKYTVLLTVRSKQQRTEDDDEGIPDPGRDFGEVVSAPLSSPEDGRLPLLRSELKRAPGPGPQAPGPGPRASGPGPPAPGLGPGAPGPGAPGPGPFGISITPPIIPMGLPEGPRAEKSLTA